MKPPTKRQLGYLKGLGYTGTPPESSSEASVLITALKDGDSSEQAEKALFKHRKEEKKEQRAFTKSWLKEIKQENAECKRDDMEEYVVIGFILEPDSDDVSDADKQYVNAFLPLDVAEKYPELLELDGISPVEFTMREKLKKGTRFVHSPGRVGPPNSGCLSALLLLTLIR